MGQQWAPSQNLSQYISYSIVHRGLEKVTFDLVTSSMILWPLISACSFSVLNKKAPFKPEYIIPQLLLQSIRNNVIDSDIYGIRYFSINYGQKHYATQLAANYVFPVKQSQIEGHCPTLTKLFKSTEPVTWQLANIIDEEQDLSHTPDAKLEIITGSPIHYKTTTFAKVEAMLIEQAATFL